MKKQIITVLASLILILSSTVAFAGSFNIGAAGAIGKVDASVTEKTHGLTTNSNSNNADVDNTNVFIGSVFAEYEMDLVAIGVEYIPGSADVSDKIKTRTEADASVTGTKAATSADVTRSAQAEIENYISVYAEVNMGGPLFIRAGMAQMDVNTLENLGGNSGSYGNAEVDGYNLGIGVKGDLGMVDGMTYKLYYEMTDFDTLKLTSTGNSVASETNTITADLDVTAVKLALGYRF